MNLHSFENTNIRSCKDEAVSCTYLQFKNANVHKILKYYGVILNFFRDKERKMYTLRALMPIYD